MGASLSVAAATRSQKIGVKANRQLRETKRHFNIELPTGILWFANDGFTGLAPKLVRDLARHLLLHSYSSIDCFVYLTVNRYVEVEGSKSPRLLWVPSCSDRASQFPADFVNDLGRKWCDLLDTKIGPFEVREETFDTESTLRGAHAIVLPGERGGQLKM